MGGFGSKKGIKTLVGTHGNNRALEFHLSALEVRRVCRFGERLGGPWRRRHWSHERGQPSGASRCVVIDWRVFVQLAVLLAGRLGRRGRRCASAKLAAVPSRVSLRVVFAAVTRGSGRGGGERVRGCSFVFYVLRRLNPARLRGSAGRVISRPKAHTAASHEQRRCV